MLITIHRSLCNAVQEQEDAVQNASDILTKLHSVKSETVTLELMRGKVWSRIVRVITHNASGQVVSRSAFGFIDAGGNLWKADGWKAPTKNKPRGTIKDLYDARKVAIWQYSIS